MSLLKLLTFCASIGGSWQFSESDLMTLLLRSKKFLRLSPLIPLMWICKSSLPNFTMINKLQIPMPLEEPKSKLVSTGWRLAIKLQRSSVRLFKVVIPILGLKKSNKALMFSPVSLTSCKHLSITMRTFLLCREI